MKTPHSVRFVMGALALTQLLSLSFTAKSFAASPDFEKRFYGGHAPSEQEMKLGGILNCVAYNSGGTAQDDRTRTTRAKFTGSEGHYVFTTEVYGGPERETFVMENDSLITVGDRQIEIHLNEDFMPQGKTYLKADQQGKLIGKIMDRASVDKPLLWGKEVDHPESLGGYITCE